jgi:UDPglucose--hexose-1-phosphate uridylyltransferase
LLTRDVGLEKSNGIYQAMNGLGVHEVIIESPEHVVNVEILNENQFEKILPCIP